MYTESFKFKIKFKFKFNLIKCSNFLIKQKIFLEIIL